MTQKQPSGSKSRKASVKNTSELTKVEPLKVVAPWMGAVLVAKLKEGWSKMAGMMTRMFRGMETPAEEMKEAKALKSGKITPKQYVAGEKSEGHGKGAAKKAAAIKSGKVSPAAYAKEHAAKKMACGGRTKKMAAGGGVEVKGKTKCKPVKMAKGGGVESKGKTKGKMV